MKNKEEIKQVSKYGFHAELLGGEYLPQLQKIFSAMKLVNATNKQISDVFFEKIKQFHLEVWYKKNNFPDIFSSAEYVSDDETCGMLADELVVTCEATMQREGYKYLAELDDREHPNEDPRNHWRRLEKEPWHEAYCDFLDKNPPYPDV